MATGQMSLASGSLRLMEFSGDSRTVGVRLQHELERISPAEILRADGADLFEDQGLVHTQRMPEWHFEVVGGHKALLDQLSVASACWNWLRWRRSTSTCTSVLSISVCCCATSSPEVAPRSWRVVA